MLFLNDSQRAALSDVAASLGVSADSLGKLIQAESAWNPRAKNTASSARGLIQFTDATARRLGYNSSYDLVLQNPTIESQLYGPVFLYLRQYAPFSDEGDLYLAVFYPAARRWDRNQEFSQEIQAVNPGIRTPQDYIDRVNNKASYIYYGLAGAAILGIALFIYFKRKGGHTWNRPRKI